MNDPIQSMLEYIRDFIEKPNEISGGMPLCPFAKKARLQNKIYFDLCQFSWKDQEEISKKVSNLDADQFDLYILLHPIKDGINVKDLYDLCNQMQIMLPEHKVFTGHPQDEFRIKNVFTRKDPYPNLQFVSQKLLEASRDILRQTKYYDGPIEQECCKR